MSASEGRKPTIEFPKMDAMEQAVQRALRQLEVWRERASASEAERRRLQKALEKLGKVTDDLEPAKLSEELDRLRADNDRLKRQLEQGREQAEKLAREVEFLEDAR